MARLRLSTLGVRRASAVAGLALTCLSGCSGDVINLGSSGTMLMGGAGAAGIAGSGGSVAQGGTPSTFEWSRPEPVLARPVERISFANGTFTTGAEQLYFTQQERGGTTTILSRSERGAGGWSTPVPLKIEGAEIGDASSPAISLNGDKLWFGSRMDDAPNTDIWLMLGSRDNWGTPAKVVVLSSQDVDDVPRQPAVGGTIMPLSSKRMSEHYQIWFAPWDEANQAWQEPNQRFLTKVNSPDSETADAFLTNDGLTLFFASSRTGNGDLFRARRQRVDEDFGEPEWLGGLNRPDADERDPWLNEGDQTLYFSSNRSGLYEIYSAAHVP